MINAVEQISDYLVSAEHGHVLSNCLAKVQSDECQTVLKGAAAEGSDEDDFWGAPGSFKSMVRPYIVRDGVLHIPVLGVLLNRFPYAFGSWATGYDYIRAALHRGLEDPAVQGIALVVDSPGGMVSGCFDLADEISEASAQEKPVHAYANEHAYSAAYALAAAADRITVAQTGGVGSIGVVATHVDISKMLEEYGVEFTFVHAGKHKIDGRPEKPLTASAQERMQHRVNTTYQIFVSHVARNRDMSEEAVRETEADVFTAPESVENGLADAIGPFDDAVAAFAASLTNIGGETMSKDNDNTAVDLAVHEQAVADATAAGKAEGLAEGATAERERINAIFSLEEAATRPTAARQVAMTTDMSVDQAKSFLAGLADETKAEAEPKDEAKGGTTFDDAMEQTGNPDLGAGAPKGDDDEAANPVAAIMADYKAHTG